MSLDFDLQLQSQTTEQLIEILARKRHLYEPKEWSLVLAELKNRKGKVNTSIPPPLIVAPQAANPEGKELPWYLGFLAFNAIIIFGIAFSIFIQLRFLEFLGYVCILPGGIVLQVYIFRTLKSKGEILQAKSFKKWTLRGYLFYFILAVLIPLIFILKYIQ